MSNLIINVLSALIAVLSALITKLTIVDVELELNDVELEPMIDTRVIFSFAAIDAVIAARWTIDTSVEVVEAAQTSAEFDFSSIIAALGLVTEAPIEVVETVEEVEAAVVETETVTVNNVVYTIRYMTQVDVRFSGRVHGVFVDAEGYLFEGDNGTSDFLLRVQAPLSLGLAKAWMELGAAESAFYRTTVVVTPTYTRFN